MGTDHLTRLNAASIGSVKKDKVRLHTSFEGEQTVEIETRATQRNVGMQHLRQDEPGAWKGIQLQQTIAPRDHLRVRVPLAFDTVDVSSTGNPRDIDVEFLRHDGEHLESRRSIARDILTGKTLRLAPTDWEGLERARIGPAVVDQVEPTDIRPTVDLQRDTLL
jgi:hypothetical protein